jgi:hypothetical protein
MFIVRLSVGLLCICVYFAQFFLELSHVFPLLLHVFVTDDGSARFVYSWAWG